MIIKYSPRIDQRVSRIQPLEQHTTSIKNVRTGFYIIILFLLTVIAIDAYFAMDNQNRRISAVETTTSSVSFVAKR